MVAARRIMHCPWTRTNAGTGRDFSIAHGGGEPSGAVPRYFGLPRRAFGLCRGGRDGGEPTDSDAVFRARRRTGGVGGARRPRTPDGMRRLRRRPQPGLSGWLARSRRNSVTRTSCGRSVCWPRMRAITDRAPSHPRPGEMAQGTVCKILAAHEVKPHKSLPLRRQGCVTGAARSQVRTENGRGALRLS
jgi:hypothetical protein